jgi:MFS transporter, PPP family, 3-phenylpropionic acid transporter
MARSSRPLSQPARLASFYFAFFAYSAAYVAYFPLWLAWRGLGAGEIALVLALPQLARTFAPAGWGWLADRTGTQRGIVVFSCVAMAACFTALPFAEGTRQIAVLIAVSSVLSAGALPLVEAMTLGSLPDGPARYGPIRLWGSVGFIAVLLAGGWWLDLGAVDSLAPALALLALASLAVSIGLPRGAAHAAAPASRLSIPPGAAALLGSGFCMAIAHGALYAFFTLHLQRQGYSGVIIGVLWALGVVAEIFVFAYLPALFRRYALSSLLLASFFCAIVRFLAIGWGAAYFWILVVAQLLHASTFGAFHAASVAAVHRIFPAHAQGRGQTLFSSISYGAGGAAGALLAGWGWEAAGPGLAFSLAALAGLVGAYFACAVRRAGL